jgi:ABC-type multidrug transport system fused ATPase/permease subunit
VAVRRALAPSDSGGFVNDPDAAIVAEGVSKLYPQARVKLFPAIVSIFDRWPLQRRGSSADTAAKPGHDGPAPTAAVPARQRDDDVDDDYDDDEEDEDEEDSRGRPAGPTPMRPGEMFWALRDISFRVPLGAALGVLGGPDAGKTTLLNILGGQSFATEGRVLVRDRVSPPPAALAKALKFSSRGTFDFDLIVGARLAGIDGRLMKKHRDEIEELAQPLKTPEG